MLQVQRMSSAANKALPTNRYDGTAKVTRPEHDAMLETTRVLSTGKVGAHGEREMRRVEK